VVDAQTISKRGSAGNKMTLGKGGKGRPIRRKDRGKTFTGKKKKPPHPREKRRRSRWGQTSASRRGGLFIEGGVLFEEVVFSRGTLKQISKGCRRWCAKKEANEVEKTGALLQRLKERGRFNLAQRELRFRRKGRWLCEKPGNWGGEKNVGT